MSESDTEADRLASVHHPPAATSPLTSTAQLVLSQDEALPSATTDDPRSRESIDHDTTRMAELEKDLEATRAEKVMFQAQYNSLLAKLTAMRSTLGDKLKSDAVSFSSLRAFTLPRRIMIQREKCTDDDYIPTSSQRYRPPNN